MGYYARLGQFMFYIHMDKYIMLYHSPELHPRYVLTMPEVKKRKETQRP